MAPELAAVFSPGQIFYYLLKEIQLILITFCMRFVRISKMRKPFTGFGYERESFSNAISTSSDKNPRRFIPVLIFNQSCGKYSNGYCIKKSNCFIW